MPLAMGHAQAAVSAHNDHNADSHHSKDRHGYEAAMRKRRSADRCEEKTRNRRDLCTDGSLKKDGIAFWYHHSLQMQYMHRSFVATKQYDHISLEQ